MAESGELIVKSYLKNVKKCEIVEINWNLPIENKEDIIQNQNVKKIIETVIHNYQEIKLKDNQEEIEDFINKRLLNQVEIDVVGYSKKSGYILNEVAIHTNSLNYGSNGDTVERVVKKILRLLVILIGYFKVTKGEINFFAVKSATTEKQIKINNFVNAINLTLAKMNLTDIKVNMISDDKFCKIYEEIKETVSPRSTNEFERFLNINKVVKECENNN